MIAVNVNAILTIMMPINQTQNKAFSDHTFNKRSIKWEASEYIHHDKGALWVVVLVGIALVGIGVAIWFKLWMFAFLIVIMAIAFGYYAVRKPRIMKYELNDDGLTIDSKTYPMSDFKAFGVLEDGPLFTVRLISSKRLAPAILIYFSKDDGEAIVDIFGSHIPMEHMEPDLMDILMRILRF